MREYLTTKVQCFDCLSQLLGMTLALSEGFEGSSSFALIPYIGIGMYFLGTRLSFTTSLEAGIVLEGFCSSVPLRVKGLYLLVVEILPIRR